MCALLGVVLVHMHHYNMYMHMSASFPRAMSPPACTSAKCTHTCRDACDVDVNVDVIHAN